jgi:hypothetical protein
MTGQRPRPRLPRVPVRYALLGWFYQEPWRFPRWAWFLPWWWWRIYLVVGEWALFHLWWRVGQGLTLRVADALDLDATIRAWREEGVLVALDKVAK